MTHRSPALRREYWAQNVVTKLISQSMVGRFFAHLEVNLGGQKSVSHPTWLSM
jgi:hypothetical protein